MSWFVGILIVGALVWSAIEWAQPDRFFNEGWN